MPDKKKLTEALIRQARAIDFYLTDDFNRQPSVITLLFTYTTGVLKAYDALRSQCGDISSRILFETHNSTLDLTVMCRGIELIRIPGLRYDEVQMKRFLESEPGNRTIIFTVGKMVKGNIDYLTTKQIFAPMLVTLG